MYFFLFTIYFCSEEKRKKKKGGQRIGENLKRHLKMCGRTDKTLECQGKKNNCCDAVDGEERQSQVFQGKQKQRELLVSVLVIFRSPHSRKQAQIVNEAPENLQKQPDFWSAQVTRVTQFFHSSSRKVCTSRDRWSHVRKRCKLHPAQNHWSFKMVNVRRHWQ